jgi:hypothetical protein
MARSIRSNPPARIDRIWLPDPAAMPKPGETRTYHADGRKAPEGQGTVIVSSFGVQFVWARFHQPVKAGQVATMVVGNLFSSVVAPGGVQRITAACVMDGAATEWDLSTNQPVFGDAVVELLAVERGMGVGRIVCRNTYDADLVISAGVAAPIALFVP